MVFELADGVERITEGRLANHNRGYVKLPMELYQQLWMKKKWLDAREDVEYHCGWEARECRHRAQWLEERGNPHLSQPESASTQTEIEVQTDDSAKIEQLKAEVEKLKKENESLKSDNNQMIKDKKILVSENAQLTFEKEQLAFDNYQLVADNEQLIAYNDQIAASHDSLQEEWSNAYTNMTVDLQNKHSSSITAFNRLVTDYNNLVQYNGHIVFCNNSLAYDVNRLTDNNKVLEGEVKDLNSQMWDAVINFDVERMDLRKQIEEAKQANVEMSKSLDDEERKFNDLNGKHTEAEETLKDLFSMIEGYQAERANSNIENLEVKHQKPEYDESDDDKEVDSGVSNDGSAEKSIAKHQKKGKGKKTKSRSKNKKNRQRKKARKNKSKKKHKK